MSRIRIGSFNVKNLSNGNGRNLAQIARMINHYGLDIVALQEVLGEGRVIHSALTGELKGEAKGNNDILMRHLLGKWESSWLQPEVRGKNLKYLGKDQRGEGYALLWRSSKFEVPKSYEEKGTLRDQGPKIYSNYHAAQDGLRLVRDPLYARLILKEKRVVELRILITHLIYGKPSVSQESEFTLDDGAIALRKKEFHTLAGKIYQSISKNNMVWECTVPYTLLLGDYNLNLKTSGAAGAYVPANDYEQGLAVAYYDGNGHLVDPGNSQKIKIYTAQSDLSTLKQQDPGYANNYDHFSFDDRVKRQISDLNGVRALHEFVGKTGDCAAFDTYRTKVSDHVPIIIELNL